MLHIFHHTIDKESLPKQFTYPFHYTPHPLCVQAAADVQAYLQGRPEWHDELQRGKMFGVLVVKDAQNQVGFLAAFSGNLAGSNHHTYFVPPVYDLLNPNGYFKQEEARISALNTIIQDEAKDQNTPTNSELITHNSELITHNSELKKVRKQRSIALQQWIFRQFRVHNARGEEIDLYTLFTETAHRNPPAGAGECAAPKLLQYAYLHHLQPLAMAEFWWGDSPRGEIRHHGHYYPSCRHKCEPILGFMLQGLDVEPNPLLTSNTDATQLETVYEDDVLLVVNKPAGMLSVPGKTGQASVLSILQERYPEATGPLLVHRLDMATSGLLLAAKDKDTHALLQQQFESRSVKKRYIALLDGIPQVAPKGFIRLPLRPDFDNRPLQMVDYEYGKPAVTRYVIQSEAKNLNTPTQNQLITHNSKLITQKTFSRIAFYPETGRTHQLRVHAAHPEGLNTPIVGDPLYGQPADRLYLHAESLEFRHPNTKQIIRTKKAAPF